MKRSHTRHQEKNEFKNASETYREARTTDNGKTRRMIWKRARTTEATNRAGEKKECSRGGKAIRDEEGERRKNHFSEGRTDGEIGWRFFFQTKLNFRCASGNQILHSLFN